jgi:hypothetical protein
VFCASGVDAASFLVDRPRARNLARHDQFRWKRLSAMLNIVPVN